MTLCGLETRARGGKVASRDGRDGEAETKKEDIIYYPRSSSGVSVFLQFYLN